MKKSMLTCILIIQSLYVLAIRIEYGKDIVISQPVLEDLYVAGGNITINAPVYGDLVIAGGTIMLNDTVTGDILLAGGTVVINGMVGDDLRCAGGRMRISKNVSGDLVAMGGEVVVDQGVTIGGLLLGGGEVTINGGVNGEVKAMVGSLTLNGRIGGGIDCRGGTLRVNGFVEGKSILSANTIYLGEGAVFNDDVRYWSEKESPDFKLHMKTGKLIYDPSLRIRSDKWYFLGASSLFLLFWYLGMAFLMILIIEYLFSGTLRKAATTSFNQPLQSLGTGFLFFIGIPVIVIISFITVIGVPVGLLLLTGYVICLLLATIITSVLAAHWLNHRYGKEWRFWKRVLVGLGLFVILKIITMIPMAGWIFMALLSVSSIGAILLSIRWKRRPGVPATPATA